jgi:S1-C subfamily serine protease
VDGNSRTSQVLSGVLGGLVVLVLGAVLVATDVIDTGETTREIVRQEPLTQPVSDSASDDEGLTVTEIYERDGPGVVFIQAEVRSETTSPFGLPQDDSGIATGSGFVLDKDGYILTNAHVVEGADEAGVRFTEESPLVEAEVVGSDLSTDLAVLKIDPDEAPKLTPLALGDSGKIRVGDPVIAIGNPFGYSRTVTTGIVSALQRQITAPNNFQIDNVIQTDASINPGNSGGPLIDARGQVVGINSQIATGGASGSVGIGFAVPVNTAKQIVPQLKEEGKVERAYLGVTTTTVTEQLADDLNLPVEEGALIQDVADDGPADDAGLRAGRTELGQGLRVGGDIIVAVDGQDIVRNSDVAEVILDNKPGEEVEIEYFRGDDRKTVTVKLGERPQSIDSGGPVGPGGEEPPDQGLPFPLP